MKKYIFIYDSGKGGEYTLNCFKKIMPKENYILYQETSHAPFGNKSKRALYKILFSTLKEQNQKYKIKLIVIACNTMSSLFKDEVQKIYPNSAFVEPYINNKILSKPTLVLATQNTIKSSKILQKYRQNPNYNELYFRNLAKKIDESKDNFNHLLSYLKRKLKPFANVQNVVLACTHYNYIKPQLEQCFDHKITFYENSLNVARKLKKNLTKN